LSPSAISSLSLHDALPICLYVDRQQGIQVGSALNAGFVHPATARDDTRFLLLARQPYALPSLGGVAVLRLAASALNLATASSIVDRKSTRLNSSHSQISYA